MHLTDVLKGCSALGDTSMVRVRQGVYRVIYQTVSADGEDYLGQWEMEVTVVHSGRTNLSELTPAFFLTV